MSSTAAAGELSRHAQSNGRMQVMKVEAQKRAGGLFIPMNDALQSVKQDRILLDIQILDPDTAADYSALDQLVGLCETGRTNASIKHDQQIYGRGHGRDLR